VITQVDLGKLDAADTMLVRTERLFPTDPWVIETRATVQAGRGDHESAIATTERLRDELIGNLFWRARTSGVLAAHAARQGRVADADEELRQAANTDRQRGLPGELLERQLTRAAIEQWVRRNPIRALEVVEEALAEIPLPEIDPLDRPYARLAMAYAMAGETGRAKEFLSELEEALPPEAQRGIEFDVLRARGMTALVEGDFDEAIELLRRSDRGPCRLCTASIMGYAFDRAGRTDEAIAAYEAFNGLTDNNKHFFEANVGGHTLERLGELYDEKGDLSSAAKYYAAFVELWTDADAELQPRVSAAQARLEAIIQEIG
jgi:tetratricopeptide (TPR) repeat protein